MACIFHNMPYVIFRNAEGLEFCPVLHTGKRVRNCETAMCFLRKQLFELFQCFHGILNYKCLPLQSFLPIGGSTLKKRLPQCGKTKKLKGNEQ